jgi:hypothetical protein
MNKSNEDGINLDVLFEFLNPAEDPNIRVFAVNRLFTISTVIGSEVCM